jgi:hypothetical protein
MTPSDYIGFRQDLDSSSLTYYQNYERAIGDKKNMFIWCKLETAWYTKKMMAPNQTNQLHVYTLLTRQKDWWMKQPYCKRCLVYLEKKSRRIPSDPAYSSVFRLTDPTVGNRRIRHPTISDWNPLPKDPTISDRIL